MATTSTQLELDAKAIQGIPVLVELAGVLLARVQRAEAAVSQSNPLRPVSQQAITAAAQLRSEYEALLPQLSVIRNRLFNAAMQARNAGTLSEVAYQELQRSGIWSNNVAPSNVDWKRADAVMGRNGLGEPITLGTIVAILAIGATLSLIVVAAGFAIRIADTAAARSVAVLVAQWFDSANAAELRSRAQLAVIEGKITPEVGGQITPRFEDYTSDKNGAGSVILGIAALALLAGGVYVVTQKGRK
jgi:hypothetical protein